MAPIDISRRGALGLAAAATAAAALPATARAAAAQRVPFAPDAWHQRVKRIMQLNMTERDADDFDLAAWIGYLVDVKAECTFISVTNQVAFYPTRLAELPMSRWLRGRDILGECISAARAHGIRTMGRLSIDAARLSLAAAHPDWFVRRKDDSIGYEVAVFGNASSDDPAAKTEFGPTCPFSTYYTDFVPQLLDELTERYELDGIFTNGWPRASVQPCYCVNCRKIADPHTETYRAAYQARILHLCGVFEKLVRRRNPGAIFVANYGSATKGGNLDLSPLLANSPWMFADNQGRYTDDTPSWDAAQQNRISRALIGERPVIASTGAWAYSGTTRWRTSSGNAAEVRSRLFQTIATGGTMHLHWLGQRQGFGDDRRWQAIGREVFGWHAANAAYLRHLRPLANVGLVVSPTSNRLYDAPAGTHTRDAFQGAYKALVEARIPFEILLDDKLGVDTLADIDVLVMPNIAMLSDDRARAIAAFVARGGSLLTTFETGLYDETGRARADFALADLFAMTRKGARVGYGAAPPRGEDLPGSTFLQRIEDARHPILAGFADTSVIKGGSWRVPIVAEGAAPLTLIPQYPVYPVEAVFPTVERTDTPMLVARERGGGARLVHLAGDNEATYWRSSAEDVGDLFVRSIEWLLAGRMPVTVEGDGLVEINAWRTEPGYTLHLVNHTSPNFRRGVLRDTYPMGAQRVRMTLADARPVRAAKLLRAGTPIDVRQNGRIVEFVVPRLDEYEAVALET